MKKALRRLIFYAFLLPELLSAAIFAQPSRAAASPPKLQVDSLAPKKGAAWGGTLVTIYGSFPQQADFKITFGGIRGSSIERKSNNILTVISPRHTEGIFDVTVEDTSKIPFETVVSPDSFRFVRTGTKLSLLPASAYYNGNVELNAALTDSSDLPIDSQTVTFTLNGLPVGTATTDKSGLAKLSVTLNGVSVGIHSGYIGASFAETPYHKASLAEAKDLTVNPVPSGLSLNSPTFNYGQSIELKATLTSLGAPLAKKMVSFSLNNNPAGTAETQSDGIASLSLNQILNPGPYNIKAVFAETGYDTSTAEGILTIIQAPTNTTVEKVEASSGSIISLTAKLTANGSAVKNETITFTIDGSIQAGTAATNDEGTATLSGVNLGTLGIGPGTHTIAAGFAGSTNYQASSGSNELIVSQEATTISFSGLEADYGSTVTLSAKLTSKTTGLGIKDAIITFTIEGGPPVEPASTNTNGEASKSVNLGNTSPGKHNITASFAGNSSYGASQAAETLTVKQKTPGATYIIVTKASGAYGGKTTLSAKLTTSSGLELSGKSIHFKLKGADIGDSLTNADGIARLHGVSIAGIDAGMHEDYIEASFSPSNDEYAPSQGKGPLEVYKARTSININDFEAEFGSTITLTAVLTSSVSGNGIGNETVNFTIEGGPAVEAAQTNSNGVATKSVNLGNTSPGKHNILVSFGGTGNYFSSRKSAALTVSKTQTETILSVSNVETGGGTVTLTAKLISKTTSLGIENAAISFSFNDGPPVGSGNTNQDGIASLSGISLPANLGPGLHKGAIRASFAGNSQYMASSGSGDLKINKGTSSVTVLSASGTYGGTAKLSAALKSGNSVLAGQTIRFYLNDIFAGENITGDDGVANYTSSLGSIDAGTYPSGVRADYAGSDNYTASSAMNSLTVLQASTNLSVADTEADQGGKVTLSAALTSGSSKLKGLTVRFKINGSPAGEAKTNENGVATLHNVTVPAELGAGPHPGAIAASFEGNKNYLPGQGTGTLTITKTNTNIQVFKAKGYYGGKANLSAKLTSSSGTPLSSMTLHFILNGLDINDAYTDENGLAILSGVSIAGIDAGLHENYIQVSFSPVNSSYSSSTGYGNLEVLQAATSISITDMDAAFGSTITLNAKLISSVTGNGVEGRTIIFKIDGTEVAVGTTGTDGNAAKNYYLGNTSPGNHTLEAFFSPSGGNYSASSGKAILNIKAASTALVVMNAAGTYGGTVTLEATLTSNGSPLSGKTISFTVNGKPAGSSSTQSNGKASVAFSLAGFDAGFYPGIIRADFIAQDGYQAAGAKGDLTVKQVSALLTVQSVTGTYGGSVNLTATLTSGEFTLTGRTVSFKLNGSFVGNASTGTNGVAALQGVSLSGINAGSYNGIIEAYFAASGNYSSCTGYGNLIVNQAPATTVVQRAVGPYNGKVNLSARLTASLTNSALSGRTLYFKLNGVNKGSAVTDDNGIASLTDISITGISVGVYNDYIEAVFSPSGGNYLQSSGRGILEVGLATTSIKVDKVTAVFGSRATLTALLTSQGTPLSGKVIEFLLNNNPVGTAVTDLNGIAVKTNVDLSGIPAGTYPGYISAAFAESNPFKGCSARADLEIKKASTSVTVLPAEVQYSDQVTLTAYVTSAVQEILNSSGGRMEFKYQVGSQTAVSLGVVTAFNITDGKLDFSFTFICKLAPCTYKILALFTPAVQANFDGSCSIAPWGPLVVKAEDALAEYSGERYYSVTSLSAYTALVTFSSIVTDYPDAFRGNITNARAEFREVQTGELYNSGIIRGTDLPVYLLNSSDQTAGMAATQPFNRKLGQSEINNCGTTFNVYTSVSGYYHALSDPALVSICIPATDNVSGGGFIISNSSSGKYRSKTGSKTSFGFSMKNNKSGKDVLGQVNIIVHAEDNKIYQIKANTISTLSPYLIKDMPGKAASFNTKAELRDITDPLKPVFLAGALTLNVEIYDDDRDNQKDAIAITLQDQSSALLYSSSWDGSKTVSQTLSAPKGGGTIRVLSIDDPVSVEEEKVIPKEYALYQNYPNPFNPSTNIEFDLPEESRVSIVIYNILGSEVLRLVDKDFPAGRHQAVWNSQYGGGPFASGIYILRISARSLSSEKSIVSTKKMMLVK